MRLISAGSLVRAQPGPLITDNYSPPFRSRESRTSLRYRTFVKLFVAAAAIFILFAPPLAPAEDSPAPKPVTVPPLEFKHSTLPNGLEIYTVQDHTAPIVAVQVWYHVGSKDDP